jgi:hypothetical protein
MDGNAQERTSYHLQNSWLGLSIITVEKRYRLNDGRAGLILGKNEPERHVSACLEATIKF